MTSPRLCSMGSSLTENADYRTSLEGTSEKPITGSFLLKKMGGVRGRGLQKGQCHKRPRKMVEMFQIKEVRGTWM